MTTKNVTRRTLLETLVLGSAIGTLAVRLAQAEEAPKLDVKDPAAVALGYVENSSQIDHQKYPTYVEGSRCDNCLQLQGKPGDSYRPCTLFAGKVVAVSGWCSGWTAEM